MLIQIVIRLVVYTDQYIVRQGPASEGSGASSDASNATDDENGAARNTSNTGDVGRSYGIDNTVSILWISS